MKRLIWSPRSIRDLESIHDHIAEDSPLYADLVVQRLVRAPDRLQQFPESGRIVPERGQPELRELIVRPFRVVYRIGNDSIQIVTVFRASRLFPDITGQRAAQQAAEADGRTRCGNRSAVVVRVPRGGAPMVSFMSAAA